MAKAGPMPPTTSPSWRHRSGRAMQSKILESVKYFHLSSRPGSALCAIVRLQVSSVLPARSRSELDAGFNQSGSHGRWADTEGATELSDALSLEVAPLGH
jgi:hypothetical protein